MRAARNILSLILVLTVIAAGLPLYHPVDINRDDRVDPKDAILQVKNVVQSAYNSTDFTRTIGDVVTALSVVAGLKRIIKSERTADSKSMAPLIEKIS